jgi:hypothetical protein
VFLMRNDGQRFSRSACTGIDVRKRGAEFTPAGFVVSIAKKQRILYREMLMKSLPISSR